MLSTRSEAMIDGTGKVAVELLKSRMKVVVAKRRPVRLPGKMGSRTEVNALSGGEPPHWLNGLVCRWSSHGVF